MLAIKHVKSDGRSTLCLCKSVMYEPNPPKDYGSTAVLFAYGVDDGNGSAEETGGARTYSSGTVFVMNENGATVDRFAFGDSILDVGSSQ